MSTKLDNRLARRNAWLINNIKMANYESKLNPWQLSPKASQLHQSVLESFNEHDRAKFAEILSRYQQNKNVQRLVESLHHICKTPQQREEIYPLMRRFIPQKHRDRFDYECSRPKSAYGRHYATYSRKHLPNYGYYTTRSLPSEMRNQQSGSSLGFERRTPTPLHRTLTPPHRTPRAVRDRRESNTRTVVLDKEVEGESFGFCIRGGAEYNIGLFVSSVDEGSAAHYGGMCLGDQILEVNRVDFRNISHQEAVEVIRDAPVLRMLLKSVGKIPGSFKSSSSYRWTDPEGNEVSPPPQYTNMMNADKSEMRLLGAEDERKVNLFVADGAEIGLKIRGGMEHGLGIFIASVERNSGADRAGIQVGDQILDVNGKCFLNISHEEAVRVLKSSQQLVIMLKDVGILPHGKRVYGETKWIKDTQTNNESRSSSASSSDRNSKNMKKTPSFHDPMGSSQLTHHSVLDHSEEILEMKARQLLPGDDLQAFAFYLNDYRTIRLSLTSFLTVLSDLLNTPEKALLFREIRSAILPRDLARFDEWIEKTEHTRLLKAPETYTRQTKPDKLSLYSYKSSDSSTTTNSWLGLFENGGEQRASTNFKFRHKWDALPHPPKDFFDDSLDSGSRSRDVGARPPDSSFPSPPVFDLSVEDNPGGVNRFKNNRTSGESKSPNSRPTSTQNMSQLAMRHDTSSKNISTHSTDRKLDTTGDRMGQVTTTVNHRDIDETFGSNNGYSLEDSTYDDDGLYAAVDYEGPKKSTGSVVDKIAMYQDSLCTSVNDTETDRTHRTYSSISRDNNASAEDVEDGLHTSVDKSNFRSKAQENRGTIPEKISEANKPNTSIVENEPNTLSNYNGFIDEEEKEIPLYAIVDKSKIDTKRTEHDNFETEIEIPPPVPYRYHLEKEDDFEESSENVENFVEDRNCLSNHEENHNSNFTEFTPSKTDRINDRNENDTIGVVETNLASFPERLEKFNGKSCIGKNDRHSGVAQKLKKGKKKSKSNCLPAKKAVDYSQPFVVELSKHSNNLGLSVTGGTDTDSKEIRIKSIKDEEDTVAGSCPLLKPGQIILGVDEKSLQNVTSGIAAMAIRQAFHSDKTVLKLILQDDG